MPDSILATKAPQIMFSYSLLAVLLSTSMASSDIHKCVDEDGNIAYQQTPCPKPVESEPLVPTPVTEEVPVEEQPAPDNIMAEVLPKAASERSSPREPADVEACKMPLRDSIDAIEAEMLRGYSAEQGEDYKEQLRGLTEQMRACELSP